jgi:hypothetical protein
LHACRSTLEDPLTSPEELVAQVAGKSLLLSLAAVPGLAGMSRQALQRLAAETAVGFGVAGAGAAATRTVQGYPEEAPKAFFEVGLSSTVVADIANALRSLARLSANQLSALRQQALVRGQRGGGLTWRDPEGEAFVNEINDAIMRLKRGDTSKYDQLLKQFEEWQKTVDEGYRARIRNHGHSCFLCEIVIRSQFHTTYEPEA